MYAPKHNRITITTPCAIISVEDPKMGGGMFYGFLINLASEEAVNAESVRLSAEQTAVEAERFVSRGKQGRSTCWSYFSDVDPPKGRVGNWPSYRPWFRRQSRPAP